MKTTKEKLNYLNEIDQVNKKHGLFISSTSELILLESGNYQINYLLKELKFATEIYDRLYLVQSLKEN